MSERVARRSTVTVSGALGPDQQGAIVTEHRVTFGDVRLHVVEQGEGPVVLLIHGFPETSYAWRHQPPPPRSSGMIGGH